RDCATQKEPRARSNDSSAAWMGDTVYFRSDRNGPVSSFSYDARTKQVKQVLDNKGYDLKTISAGPDALVYEQFGGIYTYDPQSGQARHVEIHVAGDSPSTRAHWEKVADKVGNAAISPTGARAVFEARGEILTVPAEKGDIRNLTRTTTFAERDPAWSPDSKWLTYSRFLPSHFRAVFVYSLESGKSSQVTDGLSEARFPVFDKNGKYIYLGASTDFGLSAGWLDLTSYQHPVSRNIYAVVVKNAGL